MAAAAVTTRQTHTKSKPGRGRKFCFTGTPEVYFEKAIDNSRLVKVDDPARAREILALVASLVLAFGLVMTYAFEHFRSIEYGYEIQSMKSQRAQLEKDNSQLRLEESRLSNPERIEMEALKLGLQSPQPGQVITLDASATRSDTSAPIMARAAHYSVVSSQ